MEPPPDVPALVSLLNGRLQDVFFDYDRADVKTEAVALLRQDADLLKPVVSQFPQLKVMIEGHCDERGSAEYNLALGDLRARHAAETLEQFGIPPAQVSTISYGKEAPQCTEPEESCWRRNRRAHFRILEGDPR